MSYPATVDAVENETVEMPIICKKKTRKNLSLIKKNENEIVLEDLFDKIEFIK